MQDGDPKCRHFVISWRFMAFWHVCQKFNCITKSTFSRLFHGIRLLDFSALVLAHLEAELELLEVWEIMALQIIITINANVVNFKQL